MTERKPRRKPARPARKPAEQPPVDPLKILEAIAADETLKPTPRVQACKELVRLRLALGKPAPEQAADAKKTQRLDRLDAEINARALRMMQPRGKA